jgi:hypothetical protein
MRKAWRGLPILLALAANIPAPAQTPPRNVAPPVRLRLKSGPYSPQLHAARASTPGEAGSGAAHFIAVFHTVPQNADVQRLRQRGLNVLASVPDHGLLVYGDAAADLSGSGVVENYRLRATDRLSARLNSTALAALPAVVSFQPDVSGSSQLLRLRLAGASIVPNPDLGPNEYLVRAPYATLRQVAGWDEVSYVYPAAPAMLTGQRVRPCSTGLSGGGALPVAANLVQTIGDGWAGPSHGAAALHYRLDTSAAPLAASDVQAVFRSVLAEWSAHAAITFSAAARSGLANGIDVAFLSGDHGDGFPFTPSGAVVAHTFYPPPSPEPIAGDMHLNRDEAWSVDGALQVYAVMLHEMGHALGLGHSDNPDDVMYPYYQGRDHLSAGDIAALRTLYAAPAAPAPVTPDPTLPEPPFVPTTPPQPGTPDAPVTPSEPTGSPQPAVSGDSVAPLVVIYSPALAAISTTADSIAVRGVATDNVGVTQILWSTSTGASGTVSAGPTFEIGIIPLVPGTNRIQVQAVDATGNTGSAYLTVTKR